MTAQQIDVHGLLPAWRAEASKAHPADAMLINKKIRELEAALRLSGESSIVGWINEDELPSGYPYEAMFPFSKVDGVRLFPVYTPALSQSGEAAAWLTPDGRGACTAREKAMALVQDPSRYSVPAFTAPPATSGLAEALRAAHARLRYLNIKDGKKIDADLVIQIEAALAAHDARGGK